MLAFSARFASPLLVIVAAAWLSQALAAKPGPSPKADFYVSPAGNDAWSGTLPAPNAARTDGPFATFGRAQAAVRAAKAGQRRPYTVLLRGGAYRLAEPITFAPEDSGSADAPVTYAAYPDEKPVLSGGKAITAWKKGPGEVWTAQIPEVAAGQWYFHQLFVNGERRTRARTPNEGYFHIAGPLPEIKNPQADQDNPASRLGFTYTGDDMKRFTNLEDVNIHLYHAWTQSVHWIANLDEVNHTVRFTAPSGWPVGYFDRNARYYVENCPEALDSPGEWYLDRKTGVLSYWPLPGEDMTKAEVVAPKLRQLVEMKADSGLGTYVEHVTLRGLSFQHTDWEIPKTESADGQAATFLEAAIMARGALDCTIADCEIAHVGEYALWLRAGCKDCRVERCEIHDLGGGGVRIGETSDERTEAEAARRCVVDNNFIHDGGRVFRAGIGVWIGRSSYHEVTHNEICDFDYSGCSVGWSWGYAESSANHNRFEYNHIHHIGRGVLSDMGGIYSLGISPGTTERYNLIHDVYSYSYGGWGLYTDEGSSGILLEGNVVYDTKSGGFHQHYGRENTLRNNIFAFSREGQLIRSRQEDHISFFLERNIVLTDNDEPLGGNWGNGQFRADNNLYWDTVDPEEIEWAGMDLKAWQATGQDQHSLVADPLFVNAEKRDFRLKPDSPAITKLGFVPIDLTQIGLYGDPAWVARPTKIVRPAMEIPRPPGPQPIAEDFEGTKVGELPKLATVSGEDAAQGSSIRVTDETAASGKHSLKFTDAPGLEHEWQPHMYYYPGFVKGIVRVSYDVRLEAGAIFWNEWRDLASPYRVGPSVRIEKTGELKANGKPLLTVPIGQWVHLDFVCGLGMRSTGTYELTVTVPGQQPQKFTGIPTGTPEWKRLDWFGFISLATEKTVFYIDNVEVRAAG